MGNIVKSIQFSSVAQSCPTLCDPMNCSMPGLPVHHQLWEFSHVHRVSDAIQPSHPLSSPSPPAPNPSQHQGLFQISGDKTSQVLLYGYMSLTQRFQKFYEISKNLIYPGIMLLVIILLSQNIVCRKILYILCQLHCNPIFNHAI